jgi:hypothetical protein
MGANNRNQAISLFRGVIKQDGVIGALYGNRKIFKASFVPPPDVLLWHIVTAGKDSIFDSGQIDLDVLCPDVDQDDLEAAKTRLEHHSQIILSGERGLNGKTFSFSEMVVCGPQD